MQVAMEDNMYPINQAKNHNIDLVSGQHQVVRMSQQRQTTTTVFENQSNFPHSNEHRLSSATINDQSNVNNPYSSNG